MSASVTRVLDTLGLKSQVVAYNQSTNLLRAVEQLESRTRQPLPVHPNVQVGAARGFTITSRSIPGACCTFAHSPAIPSHPPPRRSQIAAVDRPVDDNAILIPPSGRGPSKSLAFGPIRAIIAILMLARDPAHFSFVCRHRIRRVVGSGAVNWSDGCGAARVVQVSVLNSSVWSNS